MPECKQSSQIWATHDDLVVADAVQTDTKLALDADALSGVTLSHKAADVGGVAAVIEARARGSVITLLVGALGVDLALVHVLHDEVLAVRGTGGEVQPGGVLHAHVLAEGSDVVDLREHTSFGFAIQIESEGRSLPGQQG